MKKHYKINSKQNTTNTKKAIQKQQQIIRKK